MRLAWTALVAIAGLMPPASAPAADDAWLLLGQGGRVQGRWLNRDRLASDTYRLETDARIRLELSPDAVRYAVDAEAANTGAEGVAGATTETRVAALWTLAQWCRDMGLEGQREAQLQRILEIAPDHSGARYALGYCMLRGQWARQHEVQTQRGYARYEGRWRTSQEIQLLREHRQREEAERGWLVQLRRWRQMVDTPENRAALDQIAAVRDPHAVPALAELLAAEPLRRVKLAYVDALCQIGDARSIDALLAASLNDPDEEIFHACIDAFTLTAAPHIAARYADSLRDVNNARVNRAAHALGRLGDARVLSPLIEALITSHILVLPGRPEGYHATFSNPANLQGAASGGPFVSPLGAGGVPVGNEFTAGSETKTLRFQLQNPEVLGALIRLSGGANFGYDRQAWSFWLDNETRKSAPQLDGRRG